MTAATLRIAVAADHAGFSHKGPMIEALGRDGHTVIDLGTDSTAAVDYPDYARAVGLAVREGRADVGIIICGSGAGVSIAANKLRGIRAALCHDLFTARQAREDDDANVLCLGARVVGIDMAIALARQFVGARFSGEERHVRRLAKVAELDAGRGEVPVRAATKDVLMLPPVDRIVARLERVSAVSRLWRKDPTLWSEDAGVQAAIARRLGWLAAPAAMEAHLDDLTRFAADVRGDAVADVVLLGMGGSSLAAEVLARTFGSAPGSPSLTVLDTTDPATIARILAACRLSQTLFLVSSKSGTTVEMLALYRFFRAELEGAVKTPGRHFVAITDAGTPLESLAKDAGFRRTFLNDPDIGGRFSALSYFGLVPGALIGADLRGLLARAARMAARCGAEVGLRENPGLALGAMLGGLAEAGRDKVTLVLSPSIRSLGAWLEQLITESTGKAGKGIVVVHEEPLAGPDHYRDDRVFVSMTLPDDSADDDALAALEAAGAPVIRIELRDRLDVGAEFFRWEIATAVAGIALGVNPFDEPNVSQAKGATQAALATFRESGQLPEWPVDDAEDVARVLDEARTGDYIALLAYLTATPDTTAALQRLRILLRDRTKLATTVGYGPRYLHSTGQLHKGGPPTPIALLITGGDGDDLAIPGEPYGFATLKTAQALGDLATLRAAHRRALWLPLGVGEPPADAIERLRAALEKRLQPWN